MDTLSDKKTDHESAVTKKRGRPKQKETQDSRLFRCRYRSHVRTYYLEFTIVETDDGLEVRSVNVTHQRGEVPMTELIQFLGILKIRNVIRKHLITEKAMNPLDALSFHESTLLG